MNIFRLLGDLAHLASILILIHKIHLSKSCRGISFKSQLLYFIVFALRYSNLFVIGDKWSWFFTLYMFVFRVFFLGSSAYVLYLMRVRFRPTHDPAIDTIRLKYLLGPAVALGLLMHYRGEGRNPVYETLWATSIYLESVAILPQLFMLQRTGEAETITTHHIFALGAYRALYIPNWIWRLATEAYWDPISIVAGLVQTGLYLDFFYANDEFYVRYYAGHQGQHGHEFLEFEYSRGRLRYANNSNYRNDSLIRKEVWISPMMVSELKRIVSESEIMKEDDAKWPKKNIVGRQELEIKVGKEHISFETAKIGSLVDVQESEDPEGLRVFYFLVQDLRCLILSLISLHFKIKPI